MRDDNNYPGFEWVTNFWKEDRAYFDALKATGNPNICIKDIAYDVNGNVSKDGSALVLVEGTPREELAEFWRNYHKCGGMYLG